jgi:hypothetical protein
MISSHRDVKKTTECFGTLKLVDMVRSVKVAPNRFILDVPSWVGIGEGEEHVEFLDLVVHSFNFKGELFILDINLEVGIFIFLEL